ncbi:hypothetical protein ACWD25_20680 [Streptomyces sp. NPDC002920]
MSAEKWTPGERLAVVVAQEINDAPAAELIQAVVDDVLRGWAARIREVGTAKGWSTWAGAFIDPDVEFVDTGMPSTETIVAELRRLDRAAALDEFADQIDALSSDHYLDPGWDDAAARARTKAAALRRGKDTSAGPQPREGESTVAEPLVVSRYDVAMEPALEEKPVLTVGAIAEDGRPVALLFDQEARRKVGRWLTPNSGEDGEH